MSEAGGGAEPPQSGLVDMGDISFYNIPSDPIPPFALSDLANYVGSFGEIVLNVSWAQLQPSENGPLDPSVIASAISAVETYNAENNTDLGIKLRVWGGYTAPDWAKAIDGPAITITGPGTVDDKESNSETIGRFWTADYINAWTSLQNQLAILYDNNPIIRGISNTAGAAATDEPFVPLKYIPPNQPDAVNQPGELESGGYTDAAEQLTLRAAIADYASWVTTPLDYTMNLFHLQDSGKPSPDENFTLAVLQEAENSARLVQAGNHALNNPLPSSDAFVYAQMAEDAALDPATAPGSYQTASPVNLGTNESDGSEPNWGAYADWPNAVTQGVAANAGDIELWDGPATTGFTGLLPSQVQDLATTLAAGIAPVTSAPDDGAALGFIAPASVAGAAGTIAFSGVDAVLLASAAAQTSYTVTLTSASGNTLAVTDFGGIVGGPTSGATLTASGPLSLVNTVLASLTDTLQSGTDVVQISVADSSGDTAARNVGVQVSAPAASSSPGAGVPAAVPAGSASYTWTGQGSDTLFSDPANWTPANGPPNAADSVSFTTAASPAPAVVTGTGAAATLTIDSTVAFGGGSTIAVSQNGAGDLDIADQQGSAGVLVLGGVESSLAVAGNLEIGGSASGVGGSGTLLAALAPEDYSTASLTVRGTLEVWGEGIARFTGSLEAASVAIENGGTISGDGTLTTTDAGAIVNDGTIEAAADQTLGLQQFTVANALAGEGALVIDPGASLMLAGAVGPHQKIAFASNSIAQFSDDPYSPSTLVIERPLGMQGSISGFSFADALILSGVTATGASYDGANGTLTVDQSGGGPLSFALSGDLAGLTPVVNVTGAGTGAESTVSFVAPSAGLLPSITAPAALEGAAGAPVLVPDIVIAAPLPASSPSDMTIGVTLVAGRGALAAGDDNGNTSVNYSVRGSSTLTLSGPLGAVERSLQTLTYTGAAAQPKDTITITVSDYAGASATAATIAVFNNTAPLQFDWASAASGSFGDAANWTAGGTTPNTPPGGTNVAAFGPGTNTVSGDGAAGQILDTGTTTLTGQVTAQGRNGVALIVDADGALTLAGGALLTAQGQASVGGSGQGLLTLMGGALALTGPSTSNALVLGAAEGSSGTVLNLEQIEAAGTVVVGEAGSGTLELLGVAATASDGGADVGQLAGAQGAATIDGGEWANSGQLTVGDAGSGSLLIDGTASGISGQVTAFDATIGAQAGSQGSATLDGGDLLVADAAASSTLAVGAGGAGSLTIENGGNVTVGVAQGAIANNTGLLDVGGTAGGWGLIRIGGNGALLVDGNANIGGAAGAGGVTVGQSTEDTALFAVAGTLAIDGTGQIALGGANATVRASVLDLAPGGLLSGAGTLSGDGGGNDTVMLASIENDGSIAASGGNLLLYGGVAGTGALSVATGATITLQAAVGAGQTLALNPNAEAVLDDLRAFAGTIADFGSGDVLDLASTDTSSAAWSDGVLTLETTSGAIQLNLAGTYAPNAFAVQPDGLGGTDVTLAQNGGGQGDVHMLTFDGLHYDFQAVGDFVAARSTEPGNPFQVQIQTQSGNGAVSTTAELAAALGGARVTFAIGRADPVSISGAPDKALHSGVVQQLAGGTLAQLSSDTYQLTWKTGESVTVTDQGGWLDWSVSLGPHDGPGSVQGLLGSDSGQANDFRLPDGSVIPQPLSSSEILGTFADAWQVAPGTSLLDDASAPPPTTEPAIRTALAGMIVERPHFIHASGVDAAGALATTAASPVPYQAGSAVQDAMGQSAGDFFGLPPPNSATAAFANPGTHAATSAYASTATSEAGSALPFGASSLMHTFHAAPSW